MWLNNIRYLHNVSYLENSCNLLKINLKQITALADQKHRNVKSCMSFFYIVARHMVLVMNSFRERKLSCVVRVSPCTEWQGAVMDMGTWNIEREGRVCVTVHWLLCSTHCVYSYPAKPLKDQVSSWGRACTSSILQTRQGTPSAVSSHPAEFAIVHLHAESWFLVFVTEMLFEFQRK